MGNQDVKGSGTGRMRWREGLVQSYPDVLTAEGLEALEALAGFNRDRREVMQARMQRRAARFRDGRRWIKYRSTCNPDPNKHSSPAGCDWSQDESRAD